MADPHAPTDDTEERDSGNIDNICCKSLPVFAGLVEGIQVNSHNRHHERVRSRKRSISPAVPFARDSARLASTSLTLPGIAGTRPRDAPIAGSLFWSVAV